MSNHKKSSKRTEGKKATHEGTAVTAPSEQPGAANKQAVHDPTEMAPPKGAGFPLISLCTLLISGATILTVVILSSRISEKLQQKVNVEQMDKLTAQVSRLTGLLEESLKHQKEAVDASLKASRLDQRAWVGVKSIQMFPMEVGKPLKMEIKFSNSGKTFALDVRHTGILRLSDKPLGDVAPEDRENLDKQPKQVPTLVTLAPGGESLIPCASLAPITEEMVAAINTGKVHVYLVGEISYTDVFKQWHTTRFFQKYVPAEQKFMAEQSHNDAD